MAAKTTDWRPGPTVCRCCLSEGCYKDISTEYFWMGKREVYAEMLSETLNLSIAYSTSGGPNSNSRLICEPCISRLRDASDFKRQVQECEKTFMQYLDPGSEPLSDYDEARVEVPVERLETQVKVEPVKTEKDDASDGDGFDDRAEFLDDDDDDLDDQPLTRLATKVPKKESVDLLELLGDTKPAEKRKATTKAKAGPAKKAKTKKEVVKATSSKATKQTEKKKKGDESAPGVGRPVIKVHPMDILRTKTNKTLLREIEQKRVSRDSAIALIYCANVCPFKFNRFFMCLYCPSRYRNMPELVQHVELQHKHATEEDIRKSIVRLGRCQPIKINVLDYACKLCNDDICNFEDLKNHLIGKHKKRVNLDNDGVLPYKITEDEFICVLCEKKMEQYRLLNSHINEHYTKFICDQCGAVFASDMRLKAHVSSHEVGAYPCEECGKVFTKVAYKQLHLQTVHLKAKRNKCTICDETFRDYYQKQKHLLSAHGVKQKEYKCNFCPRSFVTSSNLRAHERRNHIKSQTYTCDVCDYTSFSKDFLTRHLICHTDEKNFKCQVCKKTYARKKTLTEHMRIHNNDRRFPCQYCDRAFIQKCSLKGHMKTHHKEFPIF